MDEKTKLEVAKLATQLTIALIEDRHGRASDVTGKRNATTLDLFDSVYDHLLTRVSDK